KKEDKFAELLTEISNNLVVGMDFFAEYAKNDENGLKDFAIKMKEYEHKGDSFVHTIIHDLNKVFIMPIECEDILALAMRMDDVIDGLDSTSALFEMYNISGADEFMLQFIENIHNAIIEIDKAVALISKKKLPQIRNHAIRIKDYESKCDDVLRSSIKNLFQHSSDPIFIMQYKEIYEEFEGVADSCEDVANTLEAIIMKNAWLKEYLDNIDTVLLITILIVACAVIFDFINGFHDTANAIATSVSTKALQPRHAIMLASFMNFLGAMTFTGVAQTITKDIVDPFVLKNGSLIILAALLAAITWNLITWYFGIPSSSSHALIGSIAGAAIMEAGFDILNYSGFIKIIQALIFSPLIAFVIGFIVYSVFKVVFK